MVSSPYASVSAYHLGAHCAKVITTLFSDWCLSDADWSVACLLTARPIHFVAGLCLTLQHFFPYNQCRDARTSALCFFGAAKESR